MRGWRKLGCLGVLIVLVAVGCGGSMATVMSASGSTASGSELTGSDVGIPDRMFTAYQAGAATVTAYVPACQGMRWQVLAGVARIESNHAAGHAVTEDGDITPRIIGPRLDGSGSGGNTTAITDTDDGRWDGDKTYDRAVGPFQFLPGTFRAHGADGNGDAVVDPHNADDAALTAAIYLCGSGRDLTDRAQLKKALYAYNHSDAYVDDVLGWIDQYDAAAADSGAGDVTGDVQTVLTAALAQKGVPYSWGGGNAAGPSSGKCCSPGGQDGRTVVGFDCSGLTLYAFAQAGVTLPRTAASQSGVGTRIPASAGYSALQVGDLVFYGYIPDNDSTIHHVGIYLGNGNMINAARPGTRVRVDKVSSMADYAGGARVL